MKTQKPLQSLGMTIESRMENVGLLGAAAKALCQSIPLGSETSSNVELAVVEAVTNVIKHSYNGEPGHIVNVDAHIFPDKVVFEIKDRGRGMEPADYNDKKDIPEFNPSRIESFPEGGMGLPIIHSAMDEIIHQKVGKENIMTLVKMFNGKIDEHRWTQIERVDKDILSRKDTGEKKGQGT